MANTEPQLESTQHQRPIDPLQVVALSPQFWAYTPLFIGDVHRLYLDPTLGLNCWLSPPSANTTPQRKIPIVRCKLVGVITCAAKKAKHVAYVLDDGTGCIDCTAWEDQQQAEEDLFFLLHHGRSQGSATQFVVGDVVQVYGKIKLVYLPSTDDGRSAVDNTNTYSQTVREIQVKIMQYCDDNDFEYDGPMVEKLPKQVSKSRGINEISHWVQCLHFSRRASLPSSNQIHHVNVTQPSDSHISYQQSLETGTDTDDQDQYCSFLKQQLSTPIPTGDDILSMLSQNERQRLTNMDKKNIKRHRSSDGEDYEIKDRQELKYGACKLFGPSCPCNDTNGVTYKDNILYCHCIATKIKFDPHFSFRDLLLDKLVSMEQQKQRTGYNITDDRHGQCDGDTSPAPIHKHIFTFVYHDICQDAELLQHAQHVLSNTNQSNANVSLLFIETFRALRNDGIIYLVDEKRDQYMLISVQTVLFPYIQSTMNRDTASMDDTLLERMYLRKNPPDYLRKVPAARLHLAETRYWSSRSTSSIEPWSS
jgi:hypothetical protein